MLAASRACAYWSLNHAGRSSISVYLRHPAVLPDRNRTGLGQYGQIGQTAGLSFTIQSATKKVIAGGKVKLMIR
jgi:hypothetical protein